MFLTPRRQRRGRLVAVIVLLAAGYPPMTCFAPRKHLQHYQHAQAFHYQDLNKCAKNVEILIFLFLLLLLVDYYGRSALGDGNKSPFHEVPISKVL